MGSSLLGLLRPLHVSVRQSIQKMILSNCDPSTHLPPHTASYVSLVLPLELLLSANFTFKLDICSKLWKNLHANAFH